MITAPNEGQGVSVDIESGETIKSLLNKINKDTGVNAFYDSHTGQIALTSKQSGKGDILVDGLTGNGVGTPGQNAKFTFNGLKQNVHPTHSKSTGLKLH